MPASASLPIAQAVPVVRRALKILADREVSPQTGLLKSTLLQLDSTFSERTYGASSFLDFVEKLSQAGLVQLKHAGRSVMVELVEGADAVDLKTGATPSRTAPSRALGQIAQGRRRACRWRRESAGEPVQAAPPSRRRWLGLWRASPRRRRQRRRSGLPSSRCARRSRCGAARRAVEATESQADGVTRVGEILKAATTARWPMYLRNVKQLLRAADGAFDERRYGFAGLVELVRGCQKEGLVRLERDRRGGLRVFPGPSLQRVARVSAGNAGDVRQPDRRPRSRAGATCSSPARKPAHESDRGFQPRPFDTAASRDGRRAGVHRCGRDRHRADADRRSDGGAARHRVAAQTSGPHGHAHGGARRARGAGQETGGQEAGGAAAIRAVEEQASDS